MASERWKNLPSVKIEMDKGWVKVYEAENADASVVLDSNEGAGAWYGEEAPESQTEKGITCKEGDLLEVPKGNTLWIRSFKTSYLNASIVEKL